jgi:hypothetical protein
MSNTKLRRILLPAVAVACFLASDGAAAAGTYVQHTCRLPDGSPAEVDGWVADATWSGFSHTNGCSSGGGLNTTWKKGTHFAESPRGRGWFWEKPSDVSLIAARFWRAFYLAAGNNTTWTQAMNIASSEDLERNEHSTAGGGNGVASGGMATDPQGPSNAVAFTDASKLGASRVLVALRCIGQAGSTCEPSPSTPDSFVHVHRAEFTLLDQSAPTVSGVGGSLTTGGPKRGTESLSISASDQGGGVYRALVEVDGATIASPVLDANGGRCADAVPGNETPYEFQHRVPCPASVSGAEVAIDTTKLADGERTVRVRVEDAAGNLAAAWGPQAVTVANGASSAGTQPQPQTQGGFRITLDRRSNRIAHTSRPTFAGRLTDGAGRPVPGGRIEVSSRRTTVSLYRLSTVVTTDAQGRFRTTIPTGPSRQLRFAYRPTTTDPEPAATATVSLKVSGRISLRLSHRRLRNGKTLVYRGRLTGMGAGRRIVQVRALAGRRWLYVCVTRTDRRGRFTCRHRFRTITRPVTFTFRAVVPRQAGYPYEPAWSPARRVSVRP